MYKLDDIKDIELIKKEIDKYEYISFDIFDTLIRRPFIFPEDLFLYIELKYNFPDFAKHRKVAQKIAESKSLYEEISIDDIYEKIDESYYSCKNIEIQLEEKLCKARYTGKILFDYALSKNKKILLLSDIYLSYATVKNILKYNGYSGAKLFISSELKIKKSSGSMFHYVLGKLNINKNNMLHIGDDYINDYKMPKNIGIKSLHLDKEIDEYLKKNRYLKYLKTKNNLDLSFMLGICSLNNKETNDFWYDFGFEIAGPVLCGYTNWIIQQVSKIKADSIVFVARDGFIIKKFFDYVTNNKYKTSYIYGNRKIKLIFDIDYRKYKMWDDAYESAVNSIINYYSSYINNKCLPNDDISNKICWIDNNYSEISNISKYQSNLYKKYLENEIFGKEVVLVDGATINFSSQSLLNEYLPDKNIYGLYYLREYMPYKGKDVYSKFKYSSYHKDKLNNYLNWDFMEFILSSPEQSIKSFTNGKPVFNKCDKDDYRNKIYPNIIKGAFDFYKNFEDAFKNENYIFDSDIICYYINNYYINANKNIEKHFKNINHQVFDIDLNRVIIDVKKIKLKIVLKKIINISNNVSIKIFKRKIFYKKIKNNKIIYYFIVFPIMSKE